MQKFNSILKYTPQLKIAPSEIFDNKKNDYEFFYAALYEIENELPAIIAQR